MGSSEKWSNDWEHFDWESVWEKLPEAEKEMSKGQGKKPDAGISREELIEYFEWLRETRPEVFIRAIVAMKMEEEKLDCK